MHCLCQFCNGSIMGTYPWKVHTNFWLSDVQALRDLKGNGDVTTSRHLWLWGFSEEPCLISSLAGHEPTSVGVAVSCGLQLVRLFQWHFSLLLANLDHLCKPVLADTVFGPCSVRGFTLMLRCFLRPFF